MRNRTSLMCGTGAILAIALLPNTVAAQISPLPEGSASSAVATDQASSSGVDARNDIIVTGSRIAKRDGTSDSPILTIEAAAFQRSGAVTLEQTLNQLPQFVAGQNASSNDNLAGGITTLSLRGLGSNRTLVLLDSHRIVPGSGDGSVDISLIPEALLQTVETITGGASSTYGSDAVAGVVNFKLNRRFTGLTLDAQAGVTEQGDGSMYKISAAAGTNFADGRGHVQVAISYANRDGLANADRPFSAISRPSSSLTTGAIRGAADNYPSQGAVDNVFAQYGVAAGSVPRTSNLGFNQDGSLFKFSNGVVNYRGDLTNGYSILGNSLTYAATGPNALVVPYERINIFGSADYELTDNVTAYVTGIWNTYTAEQFFAPVGISISVPVTNGLIPADLSALLASRPDPEANFTLQKRYSAAGLRFAQFDTTTYQIGGGLKGQTGLGDWTWDLYGSYGHVRSVRNATGAINTSALTNLLSAPDGGASLCAGGLNPFGDNPISASCLDYILRRTHDVVTFSETTAEANFQGGVIDLPYGEVRAALGGSYRRDSYNDMPDPQLVRGELQSFGDASTPSSGKVSNYELYWEVNIPLLADLPFFKKLAINAGYRYSHYNTIGGVHTYKVDGQWQLNDSFMVRGGYARAVRAPSIGELFAPQSTAFPVIGLAGADGQGDPCDVNSAYRNSGSSTQVRSLCLAQGVPGAIIDSYTFPAAQLTTGLEGGNRNLKAEKANTFTVGAVLAPKLSSNLFRDLSLSVDYYHIDISNVIGTIDGTSSIQKCYNYDGSNPDFSTDNVYCSFISRDPTSGEISRVAAINANLGSLKTSGIDVAANWTLNLAELGFKDEASTLRFSAAATWLESYKIQNFPGEATTDFAGSIGSLTGSSARPRWKSVMNLTYGSKGFDLGVQWRHIAGMKDETSVGFEDSTTPGVPTIDYFDLNAVVRVADKMSLRLGVTNLGDRKPPVFTSFVQSNTDPGTYDIYGRAFYIGANVRF